MVELIIYLHAVLLLVNDWAGPLVNGCSVIVMGSGSAYKCHSCPQRVDAALISAPIPAHAMASYSHSLLLLTAHALPELLQSALHGGAFLGQLHRLHAQLPQVSKGHTATSP